MGDMTLHPADFTLYVQQIYDFCYNGDQVKALNTELVGLSVDSLYAL